MKNSLVVTNLFLIGISISSLVISPFILDFTLLPRFIFLSAALLTAFFVMYKSQLKLNPDFDLIVSSYIAFAIFCSFSVFWAKNKSESIFEASKIILSVFIFLLTYFSLKSNKTYFTNSILKLSVVLFFVEFAIGVFQFLNIGEINKDALYSVTGLNGHKNLFSSFLFLNLFFLIQASLKLSSQWKTISRIFLVLNFVFILLLQTKAVWIGCALVVFIYLILLGYKVNPKKIKLKLNSYVILFVLILIANLFFLKTLQPIISKAINYNQQISTNAEIKKQTIELDKERLLIWEKTYDVIKKNLLLGVGMGNWQIYYPDATLTGLWRCEDLNFTFQRPHNDFLWMLSEVGLIGFNLFLFFLLGIILFLFKTLRLNFSHSSTYRDVLLCIAFIIGYFSISFFDFPKERIEHLIWINILLGISYFYIREHHLSKSIFKLSSSKLYLIAGSLTLLFILYTGLLRYEGEYNLRKMYVYKANNLNTEVVTLCDKASSFAYTTDPTSLPISWYIGNADASLGNYQKAHEAFKLAYRLNPYNRNVLNDLASSYAFTNSTDSAKKYYVESARISPRFDEPKLNLAALYIREENYKEANFWLSSLYHDSKRRSDYQKIVEINTSH